MAKNMARLEENTVINIEWLDSETPESENLKNSDDYPIEVGDTYLDGKWYRDGVQVLNWQEIMEKRIVELEAKNAENEKAYSDLQAESDAMLVDYEYRLTLMELGLTEE